MDYDDMQLKVAQSGSQLVELHATLRQMQTRIDRQSLVIQVLKEMLLSQPGLSEQLFEGLLQRATAQRANDKNCRKCNKPLSSKHNRCMYCGEPGPDPV
jgi:hypothetical protein